MKIIEEPYIDYQTKISIKNAEWISDYKIKITFNDQSQQIVDFEAFLRKSQHPAIRKYLDMKKFNQFKVKDGNLNWNDYDMIFPVENLKAGKIP